MKCSMMCTNDAVGTIKVDVYFPIEVDGASAAAQQKVLLGVCEAHRDVLEIPADVLEEVPDQ